MIYAVENSPVGPLTLVSNGQALTALLFAGHEVRIPAEAKSGRDRVIAAAEEQLRAYFAGRRKAFDLPLAPQGTAFQQRVWSALLQVSYGRTASYADVARLIRAPNAMRAVGAANGRNPIAIIVPCHRIIGADGSLTGYGGGLDRKRFLLALESGQSILAA